MAAANQTLWLTFAPITTDAAAEYGVSVGDIGWLAQIFPLLYVVLALPAGFALDRWFRPSLAVGAGLTAVGAMVRLIGSDFVIVLIGQIIIAIAQPLILNAVTRISIDYARERDRPAAIGVGSAGMFAGMVIALLLGTAFGGSGLRDLLIIQAVFAVVAAVALLFGLSQRGRHTPAVADGEQAQKHRLRSVWADPLIRTLTGIVAIGFGAFIALTTWLQALLEPAGIDATEAGILLLAFVVAGIIGSMTMPPLIARWGRQQRWLLIAIAVSGAGTLLLAFSPGYVASLAICAVIGFFLLTSLPIILEMAERRAGPASGTATALLWLSGNAAGLVIALLVQQLLGLPAWAFVLIAVVMVIGLPLVQGLPRAAERSQQPEVDGRIDT
ncbi:MAG: MFS transporter [Candidatus Nanopelagicales bacterium]